MADDYTLTTTEDGSDIYRDSEGRTLSPSDYASTYGPAVAQDMGTVPSGGGGGGITTLSNTSSGSGGGAYSGDSSGVGARVDAIYQSVFGRPADVPGLMYYGNALMNGASMADIEQSLKGSKEYADLKSGGAGTVTTGKTENVVSKVVDNTAIEDSIAKYYLDEFGREFDKPGLDFYANKVRSGEIALADIPKLFSASSEGVKYDISNLVAGKTTQGYLDPSLKSRYDTLEGLFDKELYRKGDLPGLEYWLGRNLTNEEYAKAFAESPEAQVQDAYREAFGTTRGADAAGLKYYMDQLASGKKYADIVASMKASDEYNKLVIDKKIIEDTKILEDEKVAADKKLFDFGAFPIKKTTRVNDKGETVESVALDLKARPAFSLGVKDFSPLAATKYQENPYVTNVFGGSSADDASRTGVGAQKVFSNNTARSASTLGAASTPGSSAGSTGDLLNTMGSNTFADTIRSNLGTTGSSLGTTGGKATFESLFGAPPGSYSGGNVNTTASKVNPNTVVGASGYAPGDVYGPGGTLYNNSGGNAGGNSTVVSLLADGYASPSDVDQLRYLYDYSNKFQPGSGSAILNSLERFDPSGAVKAGILGLDASKVRGPITSSSGALGDPNVKVTYANQEEPTILDVGGTGNTRAFGGAGDMVSYLGRMSGNVDGAIKVGSNQVTSVTRNPPPNVLNPDGTVNLSQVSSLGTGAVGLARGGMVMSDPVMRRAMFRNGGPVSSKGFGITSNVTTPEQNAMAMQTMFQPPGFRDGGPVQYFQQGGEAEAVADNAALQGPESVVVPPDLANSRGLFGGIADYFTGGSRGPYVAQPDDGTAANKKAALQAQANAQMRQAIDDRDDIDRQGRATVSEDKKTPPPDAERKAPVRDRLTIRLDELKAEREANKAQRKENQLLALMQAGFAMAAGRSPNALANISAGGASGVATLADLEKGRRAEDIALRREIVETELAGERTSEARAERQAAREDRTLSRDVAALKSEQDLNARYAIAANSEKRQLNDIIGDNTGKFSEDKKKEAAAQLLVLEQNLRQRELRERELSRALSPRSVQQGSGDFRAREVGSPRPTPQR